MARLVTLSALAALAGALLVTGPVGAHGSHARHHKSKLLKAVLKGKNEFPGQVTRTGAAKP